MLCHGRNIAYMLLHIVSLTRVLLYCIIAIISSILLVCRKDYNHEKQVNMLVNRLRDMGLMQKFMVDSLDSRYEGKKTIKMKLIVYSHH